VPELNTKTNYEQELAKLRTLANLVIPFGTATIVKTIKTEQKEFPLYCFEFGSDKPDAPLLLIVGGVHGLEFIGSQISIALLESLIQMLHWDTSIRWVLERIKIIFYPMANPVGLYQGTRSNMNGIDIMRNSPIDATEVSRVPFISGHRITKHLPWYRGTENDPPEIETQVLHELVLEKSRGRPFVFSLDIHSGFGTRDRLWFPYAYCKDPFHHIIEVTRFKSLYDLTFPNHVYLIEPQSRHYTTHGDLWDYCFLERRKQQPDSIFLPFCLELGSWSWVRKNPFQIFSLFGMFNPVKPHRVKRAMRRHQPFFDFLIRTTLSWEQWAIPGNTHEKAISENKALKLWYS